MPSKERPRFLLANLPPLYFIVFEIANLLLPEIHLILELKLHLSSSRYMVYCKANGYWGEPFFHDACMSGCPTEPTTTTSTETPELELVLPALVLEPAEILQDHLDPDCLWMNHDGVMVSCYGKTIHYTLAVLKLNLGENFPEPPEARLGTLVPQITTGTPTEGI